MAIMSLFHEQEEKELRQEREQRKKELADTPPVEFMLTLFDGTPVKVIFKMRYLMFTSHFEFHGGMTETGYLSHFPGGVLNDWTEAEIRNEALAIANGRRKELLESLKKKTRKAARQKHGSTQTHTSQQ